MPPTAATVAVPPSVAPPGFPPSAIVTLPANPVLSRPSASSTRTTIAGAIDAPTSTDDG